MLVVQPHDLSNVHTWDMFFFRHLANISFMVPFWASIYSGFVPIWGPHRKPRCPEKIVYSPNDSFSHFSERIFPPNVPQQHTEIISYSIQQYHLHLLYITFICTFTSFILYPLFISSLLLIFMAGWLPSAPCVDTRIPIMTCKQRKLTP